MLHLFIHGIRMGGERRTMVGSGILFTLVGPSGAGKNTLMALVQEQVPGLHQLPTATTRSPRPGEIQGVHHLFVSAAEFRRMHASGELVECQIVHEDKMYGTPRQTVQQAIDTGKDLIADIEFLGAKLVYEAFPEHTVLIFITPSSPELLAERIRQRDHASRQSLTQRLARGPFEATFAPQCHYLILNDLLPPAVEHLRQIVISERARRRNESPGDVTILQPPRMHASITALVCCGSQVLTRGNRQHPEFPSFALSDRTQAPHLRLAQVLPTLSGQFTLDLIEDARFDFPAPHHVAAAAIPNDAYLHYTYRCSAAETVQVPGWEWVPAHELTLPRALRRIVAGRRSRRVTTA